MVNPQEYPAIEKLKKELSKNPLPIARDIYSKKDINPQTARAAARALQHSQFITDEQPTIPTKSHPRIS